jgi:hypothetical protein
MIASLSYNRAYLASCLRHSAQIPLRGTSDTLRTLGEIMEENMNNGDDFTVAPLRNIKMFVLLWCLV